jgi:hypothetical protein
MAMTGAVIDVDGVVCIAGDVNEVIVRSFLYLSCVGDVVVSSVAHDDVIVC